MSESKPDPKLSVIIPCLNEAPLLDRLLEELHNQVGIELNIIVADGGSSDNTRVICNKWSVTHSLSKAGRGHQMNQAFDFATANYLLFLHCDSQLNNPELLSNAFAFFKQINTPNKAGHFPLKFFRREKESHSMAYRYMEEKTLTNRPDTINGDQGLLISKTYFEQLGRFDESLHFLEDQKISHKIFQSGTWVLLPGHLMTSARRFEKEGHHRLYILMGIMMGLYKCNVTPFFKKAPELYREQKHTNKLLLVPFFKYIWHMNIYELGFWGSLVAWYKVGRYIRSQTWQMFYFFDQLLRPIYRRPIFPLLWFSDRIFYPITSNPISNIIVMIVGHIWFMWVLFPYFYLRDEVFSSTPKKVSQN